MSFSESRYDLRRGGGLIFGIQPNCKPNPNAWVPIIPNIRPLRNRMGVQRHIGFQKTTWSCFEKDVCALKGVYALDDDVKAWLQNELGVSCGFLDFN